LIRALLAIMAVIGLADIGRAEGTQVGRQEYLNSCASCHGETGKGDGPVARSLKLTPSDLSRLSESNKGVFPFSRVYDVIDGRLEIETHGKRDMPVWGEVYKPTWGSGQSPVGPFFSKEMAESMVRARILALVEYLSTLQGK
jgi:mono/diheme cytochrome c family protein